LATKLIGVTVHILGAVADTTAHYVEPDGFIHPP
jgi:hypothetical protein